MNVSSGKSNNGIHIHVLVAEDSRTQAEQLRHLLQQQGYAATVTANGKDALAEIRREKPAILVSDIVMPEMDGYQLCHAVKSDPALQDIPVILVTALASVQDVIRGLECGADNFIRKPYESKYLLSRIRYLLENRALRDSEKVRLGVEIRLAGQRHFITAERQQILDILISIYEDAVRINEELAQSNQALNSLCCIAENLNHAASEQEVTERAVQWAMEFPGVRAAWLFLRQESGFRLAAACNAPAVSGGGFLNADCSCRRALLEGDFTSARNVTDCALAMEGTGSHAALPLGTAGSWVGILNLARADGETFSADELKTLQGVGSQVAVALMRAQLHDRLESLVEQRTMALKVSEARFSGILDVAYDAIISVDAAQNVILFNKGAERIFGYESEEVFGKPLDILLPEGKRALHRIHAENFLQSADNVRKPQVMGQLSEISGRRKNGEFFPAEVSLSKLDINGETIVTSMLRDISPRKEQETRILRLNRVYAVLSGINMAIVHLRERQALFDEVCRIALEHGHFRMAWVGALDRDSGALTPAAWAGIDADNLGKLCAVHATAEDDVLRKVVREARPFVCNDLAATPALESCRELALAKGFQSVAIFPLCTGREVEGVIALYADEAGFFDEAELRLLKEMTGDVGYALENIEKERQLDYLAYCDTLTGLCNRAHFIASLSERLAWARTHGSKVGLIVLDLDRFKIVNDSLGYNEGDELLKQVARRLEQALGEDALLARSGSDAFAIALSLSQVEDLADLSRLVNETLFAILSKPFVIDDQDLRITVSAGAAVFPDDGDDAETLFRNAEAALAKAKQAKEKFLFYAQEMNARVSEILTIENKLRKAVANREFLLHYQPKLDLKTSLMCSMEALIRWKDPENGLIFPGSFIPILEETGMILDAGRWALDAAASQQRSWLRQGHAVVPIAVNISVMQLKDPNFIGEVEETLKRHELQAGSIELEITESVIMESAQKSIDMLKTLRNLGVNSAIDDFGTGYSSLSYLIHLPITHVKIDRAFIINMAESPDDLAIVSSVITLAHGLNLKVVAEGVETEEQLKLLRLLKCDEIQGYIYSRPLPAEAVEAMLAQNAAP